MKRLFLLAAIAPLALLAQQKKIVVLGFGSDPAQLQSVSDKVRIVAPAGREAALREVADADALIGVASPDLIRAGAKLKWVQVLSAGVETALHLSGGNELRDRDIILTNNQIVQGPEIADHALAMLLYLSRDLPRYVTDKQTETWRGGNYKGIELNGKSAVIIGCGGIGMQIAVRSWAFGMKVTCVDPEDLPFSPFVTRVVKPDQLDEVLPGADTVFVSAPHTPKSHKMLGPKQFELMKQNSYFIAVSRGALYDLPSLNKALDSRRLAGAGVDVTDPEPLPQGNALWKFPNAIVTPHIAGRSDRDRERMVGTVRENIRRFAEGLPLLNVVDKQKGY
jgi:phosphoglycerate dehydrogenase-like enzyme